MNLLPTPEQQQIHDAVATFAHAEFPVARLHLEQSGGGAAERARFGDIAAIGWFGLGIPQDLGGVGYGPAEDLILFRECGRQLVSPLVLAMRIGAEVAARCGDNRLAAEIIGGRRAVAMARASRDADLARGTARLQIADAEPGDLVLIWTGIDAALFDLADLTLEDPQSSMDQTIVLRGATLAGARPVAIHQGNDGALPLLGRMLGAAMLVGIAEASRDQAVEYTKVRVQFGKAIGTFQAVQHRCANMAVSSEVAWAQAIVAALSIAENSDDAEYQVAAATMLAAAAAVANARGNIQIHGGMGFSAECDAHLYMKRAHYLERLVREGAHDIAALTGFGRAVERKRADNHAS